MTEKLEIKIVNKSRHELPKYETAGAACVDLRANIDEPLTLKSLERYAVPTGLYMELPDNTEMQVRPRSGLAAKHGISIMNAPGTVDCDYRGEIKVILVNLSRDDFTINDGDRIAQAMFMRYQPAQFVEVKELSETTRGDGGLGGTGLQ